MAQPPSAPSVQVGDVLRLAEEDYKYGSGLLILRVTAVLDAMILNDGPWIALRGVQIRYDHTDSPERPALVRYLALPSARRPRPSASDDARRDG
jgi:hypothetical protein